MHDEIRKFSLEGELNEGSLGNAKERLVHHVESLMRDYDYVPALDLDPQFTVDYSPLTESFKFTISVYGVQVDKEKSWLTGGIMSGKEIPKYIPQAR